MEQESTVPKYPPAPFQLNQIPPLRSSCSAVGRAWPTEASVSIGAQCSAITTAAAGLICCAQLSKKTSPRSYCRGDPTDCIRSLHGTRGCLEGGQGSEWGCLGCCLLGTAL